jgi:hypothetical protein
LLDGQKKRPADFVERLALVLHREHLEAQRAELFLSVRLRRGQVARGVGQLTVQLHGEGLVLSRPFQRVGPDAFEFAFEGAAPVGQVGGSFEGAQEGVL